LHLDIYYHLISLHYHVTFLYQYHIEDRDSLLLPYPGIADFLLHTEYLYRFIALLTTKAFLFLFYLKKMNLKRGGTMKPSLLHSLIILLSILLGVTACGTAQTAAEKEAMASEVRQRVSDADFTFKATYAYPTGYRQIYLSPFYDVKVSPDTVRVYLPYYGRAYVAPIHPDEGGIKFISTDFDYQLYPGKKKGNWRD